MSARTVVGTGCCRLSLRALLPDRDVLLEPTHGTISPQNLRAALDLLTTSNIRVENLLTHRLLVARFSEGVALFTIHQARKVYFMME